jgi:predicted DNA-binding protein
MESKTMERRHSTIIVRVPNELNARLAEHKSLTYEPLSSFVRRALEFALDPDHGLVADDRVKAKLAEAEARNAKL